MNAWLIALNVYLACVSIVLIYMDLKHRQLPNLFTLGSYPIVALLLFAASLGSPSGAEDLARSGLAALAVMALYAILHAINPSGLGFGDVKLAPVIGAVLGWSSWGAVVSGSLYGFIAAGVVAATLLLSKKLKKSDEIPFGPFMILGMWLAMLQIG